MYFVGILVLVSLASTMPTEEKIGSKCKWICECLLTNYKGFLQSRNYSDAAIKNHLNQNCYDDVRYSKTAKNPIDTDTECPNFCQRFVPTILESQNLRDLLTNDINSGLSAHDKYELPAVVTGFCDGYLYKEGEAKQSEIGGSEIQGVETKGIESKGTETNGSETKDTETNGSQTNGSQANGSQANDSQANGSQTNGSKTKDSSESEED
ncbi:hypothetical protein OESDEN_12465 [Oesophagostomum dentatum]|uniref:Saposin B-type domain-containing protein n=1 Tax=Oesophagostomum dentatum TaxID=61180 RepID=A0A0B1SW59_OESDE|nr:hypothetical protein OESDEN_12465 [Oesophagostomum dentatum]